jgi:CheY-like chemotaxis protein
MSNPENINDKNMGKKTLLYIEDSVANMRLVEAIINTKKDIKLLSANNGEYGLELANKYIPDLILLDIHLPKMNGYVLLETLKAEPRTKDIPVIALTADASPLDIEKGLDAGFSQYITKPLRIDVLMNAINKLLYVNEAVIQ